MSETKLQRPILGDSLPPLPDPIKYPPGPLMQYIFFWTGDSSPRYPHGRLYITRGEYWEKAPLDECSCHDEHENIPQSNFGRDLSPLDDAINVFRNCAYAWGYANSRGDRDESLKLREECKEAELRLRMELDKQYI